jgi:hypothetical protein
MGMVKLGDEVKDTVSGFKGTVVSIIEYLNGCVRAGVQGKCGKDGKLREAEWIDVSQLVLTKAKTPPKVLKRTGGPGPVPQRREGPPIR